VALNCSVPEIVIEGLAGVTAIETNAAVTVSAAVPETEPEVAVIVEDPAATPVANPLELTVATLVLEEVHVALEVRSCVLLSL
jgi:hypothetical protein